MITHKSIGYSGRLGNQMFQYAALKAASLYTGFKCYIPDHTKTKLDGVYDLTNNKWIEYKLDLLDCFEITSPVLANQPTQVFEEESFLFHPAIYQIEDGTAIEGYYQSYRYFEHFEADIRKEFTFKENILRKSQSIIQQYKNPVAIHVRRGDYVKHPNYWVITPEYLAAALEKLSDEEHTYLVFSDDIEWCKQVFNEDFIFVEGNTSFEDLCMMSLCQHNIISNSSFSWWAAWLNSNVGKKVVAPSSWFSEPKSLQDLYPSNWIII